MFAEEVEVEILRWEGRCQTSQMEIESRVAQKDCECAKHESKRSSANYVNLVKERKLEIYTKSIRLRFAVSY